MVSEDSMLHPSISVNNSIRLEADQPDLKLPRENLVKLLRDPRDLLEKNIQVVTTSLNKTFTACNLALKLPKLLSMNSTEVNALALPNVHQHQRATSLSREILTPVRRSKETHSEVNNPCVLVLLIAPALLSLSNTRSTEARDQRDQVHQIVFLPSREIPSEVSAPTALRDQVAQVLQIVFLPSKEIHTLVNRSRETHSEVNVPCVPVLLIAPALHSLSNTRFTEARDPRDQVLQRVFLPLREILIEVSVQMDLRDLAAQVLQRPFPPSREILTEVSVQMDLKDLAVQVLQSASLLSKEFFTQVK